MILIIEELLNLDLIVILIIEGLLNLDLKRLPIMHM